MVTITPSDFVKEGIEKSEAAARSLFKELNVLREVVVLFDEIDEILRDRQDQEAKSGIAMLRFLNPGMLVESWKRIFHSFDAPASGQLVDLLLGHLQDGCRFLHRQDFVNSLQLRRKTGV